jgi:glutaredoxin
MADMDNGRVLYVKSGCPWCTEVLEYLGRNGIGVEVVDVSRNAAAMAEMISLSGQRNAPTMNWEGEVLADFGVDELVPFLAGKI